MRTMRNQLRRVLTVGVVLLLCAAASSARAEDEREIQARVHFAAGRYSEAVELFARLYAENADPLFLRNIGRCYQMMEKPDEAIRSFRSYLDKNRKIAAKDRKEVEGFIKQMEELKAARAAGTAPAKAPPPAEPPKAVVTTPPPAATPPVATPEPQKAPEPKAAREPEVKQAEPLPIANPTPPETKPADLSLPPPPPEKPVVGIVGGTEPAQPSGPVYQKWWFWTAVGAVVVTGAILGIAYATRGEKGDCGNEPFCISVGAN